MKTDDIFKRQWQAWKNADSAERVTLRDEQMDELLQHAREFEKDAARYQFVRAQRYIDIAACWLVSSDVQTPEDMDRAIDEAIKESRHAD